MPSPSWRKVLISGSNAYVHGVTASGVGAAVANATVQKVLVYDTNSGAFYYTGSYGSGGGGGGGNPANPNQSVQFNNSGNFGGDGGFIFDNGEDASLLVDGPITGSALRLSASNTGHSIVVEGTSGGNFALNYEDNNGDPRNALKISESIVSLRNRAQNGTVDIRANTADAGASGEVIVAQFEDDKIKFNVDVNLSGDITASGEISASSKIYAGQFIVDGQNVAVDVGGTEIRLSSGNRITKLLGQSILTEVAFTGSAISASGELSAATVTGFISADGNNRVLTSDGDGTFTAEDSLTYNGTTFALQTQNIDMTAAGGGFDLIGNITASGNISASGDLSINGIPDVSASIADAAGSGGGGVVTGYTNGANNRVVTSTGTSTINAEGGLLFNGTVLEVGVNSANRITLSGANGTLGTTSNLTIGNNSTSTNVNALLQFATKNGGYYAGSFVNTDDTTSAFSSNGKHVGEFIDVPSAANVTAGKIVYYRSTTTAWSSAQANAVGTATPLLGMAVDTATTTRAMVRGYIRVAASDIGGPAPTLGKLLYLSTGSAGTFQTLAPTTAGHVARSVGYTIQSVGGRGGINAYVVYFNPSNDYVVL